MGESGSCPTVVLMKRLESNLSHTGTTTVPKWIRDALGAQHGGRLIWELLPTGAMTVTLKYAAAPKALTTSSRPSPHEEL
jgi:hypothetical protein